MEQTLATLNTTRTDFMDKLAIFILIMILHEQSFLLKCKTSQCLKHTKPSATWENLKYIDTGRKNKKRKIRQYTQNKAKDFFFLFHFTKSNCCFYRGREQDRKNSMQVLSGSA